MESSYRERRDDNQTHDAKHRSFEGNLNRSNGDRRRGGDGFSELPYLCHLQGFDGKAMVGKVWGGFLETAGTVAGGVMQRQIEQAVRHQKREEQEQSVLMQFSLQVKVHSRIPRGFFDLSLKLKSNHYIKSAACTTGVPTTQKN